MVVYCVSVVFVVVTFCRALLSNCEHCWTYLADSYGIGTK